MDKKELKPGQNRYRLESKLKKFSKLHGYECNGYSSVSVLKHVVHVFPFSEYEIFKAWKAGKIRVIFLG